MTELIGRKLGKYELEALLGQGGMATVYRSHHPQLALPVAIKVLSRVASEGTSLLARFEREARTIVALNHPGIIRIFDIDEADGLVYMVMELIPGGTLEQRIRAGGLDRTWSADIITRVAAALDYAHSSGVVHRDIKPSNILLAADGRPVLADFGIARIVHDAVDGPGAPLAGADPNLTSAGMVLGTPAYMSPEQLGGQPVDARSDIYALGVVLYQLLTGRAPFTGDTMAVVSGHLTREPPPLRDHVPDIPPLLEAVVLQTLAKNPDHRFKSAGVFSRALGSAAEELEPGIVRVSSAARQQPAARPGQPAVSPPAGPPLPPAPPAGLPDAQPAAVSVMGITAAPRVVKGVLIGVGVLLALAVLAQIWELVGALAILAGLVVLTFAVIRRVPPAGNRQIAATDTTIAPLDAPAVSPDAVTSVLAPEPPVEAPAAEPPAGAPAAEPDADAAPRDPATQLIPEPAPETPAASGDDASDT